MQKLKCICGCKKFFINCQCVNGGITADTTCVECEKEEELYDTYNDNYDN